MGLGEGSYKIPNQGVYTAPAPGSRGSLSCGSRKSKQSVQSYVPSDHSTTTASVASSIGPPPSVKVQMPISVHKAKSDVSVPAKFNDVASLHKTKSVGDVTPSIPERNIVEPITQKPSTPELSSTLGSITPEPSIREPIITEPVPKPVVPQPVVPQPVVPQPVIPKPIIPVPSVHESPSPPKTGNSFDNTLLKYNVNKHV